MVSDNYLMKQVGLVFIFLIFSDVATAEIYFEISLERGGELLASASEYAVFSGDVHLGGGFKIAGGYYLPIGDESRNSLSLTLGYLSADNSDAEFKTTTFDAIYNYQVDSHRFGIGVSYHINPEIRGDTELSAISRPRFDDWTGLILQYSFEMQSGFSVGLRYAEIDYQANGDSFDAGSIGLFFSLYGDWDS